MLSDDERRKYESWVLAVGPRAMAYAVSLVRDRSRAEDVVQECFYRLLRRASHYNLERDGIKLLFKAISNLCINRATREKAILSLDTAGKPDEEPIPVADLAALGPDKILEQRELEEAIGSGLQKLNPLQRAAVELRALGMSKEEIGESLGVSATNAGVLVHRGRQALAKELGALLEEKRD